MRFARLGGVVSFLNIKSVFKAILVRFKAYGFQATLSLLSANNRFTLSRVSPAGRVWSR